MKFQEIPVEPMNQFFTKEAEIDRNKKLAKLKHKQKLKSQKEKVKASLEE